MVRQRRRGDKRLLVLGAALLSLSAGAEELSLEGFSGFINTPHAWVQQQGSAHVLTTNQEDPRYRAAARTRTYIFSAGFLPYLEGAVRVTEVTSGLRDLSLNAKLQLPLDLLRPGLPFAVAVGAQDEGGAAPHFRTRYVVGSAEWWRVRASLGYGTGPDRMQGVFGGVELRAFDFASLLADYDGQEAHAGVRLTAPLELLSVPLRVGVMAKTALSSQPGRLEWAGMVSAPIALRPKEQLAVSARREVRLAERSGTVLEQLEADLVEVGFENVRVGADGATLVVEYENNVFGHAEVEGLGVVLGLIAHRTDGSYDRFAAVIHRMGIRVAELEGPMDALRAFYGVKASPEVAPLQKVIRLEVGPGERAAVASRERRNANSLHTQLVLQPGVRHFVGTEASVYDAIVSVRPEVIAPLWRGGAVYARWDVPFAWTPMLERGARLASFRSGPRLDHALLTQAIPVAPSVTALVSAGVYRVVSAGALAEVAWTPGGGNHAVTAQGAFTIEPDGYQHRSAILGYRYYFRTLDAVASVKAGRFYENDAGAMLEVARYFGNVQVSAFAAKTSDAVLGVTVSLPLTPPREMKPGWLQLRGARRWTTNVETLVGARQNLLRSGVALAPAAPYSLETTFFDGSRLAAGALIPRLPEGRRAFERNFESAGGDL